MDMRSSLSIVFLLTLVSTLLSADYEGLKAYKERVKLQPKVLESTAFEETNSYFIIDFKDINKMDTFALEEKYGLKLFECIADGICVFQFLYAQTQRLPSAEILQKEANIRSIKAYKTYEFKAF